MQHAIPYFLKFKSEPHFKFVTIYMVFHIISLFKTWCYNISMETFFI